MSEQEYAKYGWILTTSYDENGKPDPSEGVRTGPGSRRDRWHLGKLPIHPDIEKRLLAGEGVRWRMDYGDGEYVAFEGRIIVQDDGEDYDPWEGGDDAVSPLDDFGRGNAGCTDIYYLQPDKEAEWDAADPVEREEDWQNRFWRSFF